MTKQIRGFTLIELIVVILILGILAAVAAPRFVNLTGQARIAALNGMRAAVSSASTLANALQSAQSLTSSTAVTIENANVTMFDGYPTSDTGGINNAVRIDATTFETVPGPPMIFRIRGAGDPANCSFTYTAAAGATPAVISNPLTAGC